MQYRTGSVNVENGSSTVTGNGTLWAANILVGSLFVVKNHGVAYQVASVTSDTELELSVPFYGETDSGILYGISSSFTANKGYPYPERGDIETASIIKRALQEIDLDIQASNSFLEYKGAWQDGTNYNAGDGVVYDNKLYVANNDHLSDDATNRPDNDPSTWYFLKDLDTIPPVNTLVYRGDYDPTTTGDFPTAPVNGDFYELLDDAELGGDQFYLGDRIWYTGSEWRMLGNLGTYDVEYTQMAESILQTHQYYVENN